MTIVLVGCATRSYVRDQVTAVESASGREVASLEARLAALDTEIAQAEAALEARAQEADALRAQALLASEIAADAEAQAAGQLLSEPVFRVEGIRFEPGSDRLTAASRFLLDQLAERLRVENTGYFLEVRAAPGGDPPGGGLAHARAEAVRRYLHVDRGLPLHVVGTVSTPDEAALGAGNAPSRRQRDPVLEPGAEHDPRVAVVVVRPAVRP